MFDRIGPWEIILILAIILIIFGAGKLPQVGSSLGKGLRSFKKGLNQDDDDTLKADKEKEAPGKATVSRTSTRKRSSAAGTASHTTTTRRRTTSTANKTTKQA